MAAPPPRTRSATTRKGPAWVTWNVVDEDRFIVDKDYIVGYGGPGFAVRSTECTDLVLGIGIADCRLRVVL